jgi:hypothetical protein
MKKLTVNVQIGGTTEMAAAFQRRQIAGAIKPIIPSSTGLCVKVLSRNFTRSVNTLAGPFQLSAFILHPFV